MSFQIEKYKANVVDALVHLREISDEAGSLRENAKEYKKTLTSFFLDVLHAPGMTRAHAENHFKSIYTAFAEVMAKKGNTEINQGDLHSSWRQYKSNILRALEASQGSVEDRAALTTMPKVQAYLSGADTGPRATLEKIRALLTSIVDSTKGEKDAKIKREVANKALGRILDKAYDECAAELAAQGIIEKNKAKPEEARGDVIESAEKPDAIKVSPAAAKILKGLNPTTAQIEAIAENGKVNKAQAEALAEQMAQAEQRAA